MRAGGVVTPVAVLGATGLVGQHLVRMLAGHPWFTLAEVVASDGRAGTRYGDAVTWMAGGEVPAGASGLPLRGPEEPLDSPVVLSALPADVALALEPALAARGHRVSSNASAYRMDPAVPLLVPEVNGADVARVEDQPWQAAGGSLVTNPNCVVAGLAPVLAPLHRAWGVESVTVATLQALSGAGLSGPGALAMSGNVVPWIPGEEEKIAAETRRLVGPRIRVDVAVTRVPVPHGHTAHLFVDFAEEAGADRVVELLQGLVPHGCAAGLPSVPARTVHVFRERDRPQPLRDLERGGGMQISVGGVRDCGRRRVALTVLSHNLVRGAAGACLANAELVEVHKGTVPRTRVRGTA